MYAASLTESAVPLPFRLLWMTDEAAAARRGRTMEEVLRLALTCRGDLRDLALLVRDKEARPALRARLLEVGLALIVPRGGRVLVHSDPSLLAAYPIHGIHIDARTSVADVRKALPPGALLGASRHAEDALDRDTLGDVDYVTLSPVFRPTSKAGDTRLRLGVTGLAEGAQRSGVPVVALGGIQPTDVHACFVAGASAVAVLGGINEADDPAGALGAYLDALAGGARALG